MFFPCLPIFSSDWCSWSCVSGDQSSRCQWIQDSDGFSSWCCQGHNSSHLQVTWCSWRFLGTSGCHSAILDVIHVCSYGGCLFGVAPTEVVALGLLQSRWLAQAYSGEGCWLGLSLTDVPDLCLVPQRPLTWAAPSAVVHFYLLLWCSLPWPCSGGH